MGRIAQINQPHHQKKAETEVSNVQQNEAWGNIKVTLDSGAADNVMPAGMIPYLKVKCGRNHGVEYIVANGNPLPNNSEITVHAVTEQCRFIHVLTQVTNVNEILISEG